MLGGYASSSSPRAPFPTDTTCAWALILQAPTPALLTGHLSVPTIQLSTWGKEGVSANPGL